MGLDWRKPVHVTAESTAEVSDFPWFALVVRSRWEKCTAYSLGSKGYQCLLPVYKDRRRWSDRWKELEVALFPGYLFCRFNPHCRVPVLSVPGVLSIVGLGMGPAPVDPSEIAAVQMIGQSGLRAEPWPFVEVGQVVHLDRGPLRGLTGIVLEHKQDSKLIISVTLLKRSVAVEIDRTWVDKVALKPDGHPSANLDVSILDFAARRPERRPTGDLLRSR